MNYRFKLSRRLAIIHSSLAVLAFAGCADARLSSPGAATDSTTISASRIKTLTLSPTADTLVVGASQQFTATARDVKGSILAVNTITWRSTDTTKLVVTASGMATARAAGQAGLIASTSGFADTSRVVVIDTTAGSVTPPPTDTTTTTTTGIDTMHAGWMVTPSGTSSGDGSRTHPWDLNTALQGAGGRIAAGDTVWLRGGTYAGFFVSYVSGQSGRPIVFRAWPGERATIDGYLRANGSDVAFWGFEVMRSTPNDRLPGIESRGARQKFINLVIHDAAQQGITFWDEAIDAEVYGCVVYNNGTHENLDHGIYVHNYTGTKLIDDNVFFNNLAYGIHVYAGPTDLPQVNVHVVGNVSFNNGTISNNYPAKGNIIIGGDASDAGMQALNNLLYFSGSNGTNLQVGYAAANHDLTVTGNEVIGGATTFTVGADWASATVQNNVIGGPSNMVDFRDAPSGWTWGANRYYRSASAAAWLNQSSALTLTGWQSATGLGGTDLSSSASATQVIVKANKYEPGRATVVVYNFGGQGSVGADVSAVLTAGQHYVVHNVQDMFGPPVASGTYLGGTISLPMTGVTPPKPIGRTTATAPRTGPNFDTFVVSRN